MIKRVISSGRNKPLKNKKKGRKLYNVVLCNRQIVDPNPGLEKWKRKEESLLLAVKTSSKQTTGKHTSREFGNSQQGAPVCEGGRDNERWMTQTITIYKITSQRGKLDKGKPRDPDNLTKSGDSKY